MEEVESNNLEELIKQRDELKKEVAMKREKLRKVVEKLEDLELDYQNLQKNDLTQTLSNEE